MNRVDALISIKEFILENESTIFDGIIQQGSQRGIDSISTSRLTPPNSYFAFVITCPTAREDETFNNRPVGINVRAKPIETAYLDIEIVIADEAILSQSDEEPYESSDQDFITVLDRVVNLIRQEHKKDDGIFRLDAGNIEVIDEIYDWEDAERYHAMLIGMIRFTLLNPC